MSTWTGKNYEYRIRHRIRYNIRYWIKYVRCRIRCKKYDIVCDVVYDIVCWRTMSYTIWVKRTTSYKKILFLPFWRTTSYVTSYTTSYVKPTMSYTMWLKRTTSYVGGLFLPFWRTTSYTTWYVFVRCRMSHRTSMSLLYDVVYDVYGNIAIIRCRVLYTICTYDVV